MKRLLSIALLVLLSFPVAAQIATMRLTNRSGGVVNQYAIVIVDSANANSFTTTTTAGDGGVVGVVAQSTIADDAAGRVVLYGIYDVTCTGSVAIADYLKTSTTAGSAITGGSSAVGAFGIALEAGTDTEISCIFLIDSSASASDDLSDDDLDALQDVDTYSGQAGGDVLIWDGTNSWDNTAISGDAALSAAGALTITKFDLTGLSAPGADRILFYDQTSTDFVWLTVGSGLTITGTTLAASGTPTVDLDDDTPILFGTSDPFHQEYVSGTGLLEISDGTNTLWSLADGGTTGNVVLGDIAVNGGDITSTAGTLNVNINGSRLNLDSGELEFENESTSNPVFGMYARDSGANTQLYGKLTCVVSDSTNASEDSYWTLSAFAAGNEQAAVLTVEADGDAIATGDVTASGGALTGGVDGSERGVLTTWDGSGGNTPGTWLTHSPNGTAYYMFVTDTGGLRYHTSLPASNSDGTAVSGSMTNWALDADSGTAETVADGNTATIAGGNGIGTAVAATDTVTVSLSTFTADWQQTSAFDLKLQNASSELYIRGSDNLYDLKFDVGALTAGRTLTFAGDESGYAPIVASVGSSGQLLKSDGDNTYSWKTPHTGVIVLTAAGGSPDDGAPCADAAIVAYGATNLWTLDFDAISDEGAWWMVSLPDDYGGGTMTPTFYYSVASDWAADTDKVNWAIQGGSVANSDALSTALGTAVEVNDVWASGETFDEMLVITGSAMTLSGSPAAGDFAYFYVYKDADDATNDTCTADGRLIAVKLEYVRN